jgi:hypothetical protein
MSNLFNNETGMIIENKKFNSGYEGDEVDQDDQDEQIVMDLFGKMLPNFDELENLISHKAEDDKNRLLSDWLFAVLVTPNPVKSLNDTISYERSMKAKFKFVYYVSKSMKIPPIMAETALKNLIKNNPWIKKRNQI